MPEERCPSCGRFVSDESAGFFDTDPPAESLEDHELRIYCDETCRDRRAVRRGAAEHVRLTHHVTTKTPKNERASLAKAVQGRLLVAPDGSRAESPDQQRLFDSLGRPIGLLDPLTGEIKQEPAPERQTLGRVGRAVP